jgi:DDE superfamily endonuclease
VVFISASGVVMEVCFGLLKNHWLMVTSTMIKRRTGQYLYLAYSYENRVLTFYMQTNIQATVDHQCRFTSHELGWPGSVLDMKVWMHHQYYFKNSEYILVDKGQ